MFPHRIHARLEDVDLHCRESIRHPWAMQMRKFAPFDEALVQQEVEADVVRPFLVHMLFHNWQTGNCLVSCL